MMTAINDKMFLYYTYGLKIQSAVALPELVNVEGDSFPDVVIHFGKVPTSPSNIADRKHYATSKVIDLHYEGMGSLRVRDGREIVVDPLPGVNEIILRVCILGPALAALLHQRGVMTLHASAVMINEVGIAFVGDKGFGKSTMAGFLQTRQHRLLSDDIVALNMNGTFEMWPSYPQLKLWPSAAQYIGMDIERMPRLQADLEKRIHNVQCEFLLTPVPIQHIYVLDISENVEIVPLRPYQAFQELVRHSYMHRFLQATDTVSLHFRQCSEIARSVPLSYLKRPRSLARLPEIADLLEQVTNRHEMIYA